MGEPNSAVSGDERPQRRYVDAGTSGAKSASPASATSATFHNPADRHLSPHGTSRAVSRQVSVAPRTNYTDASCQTDPVEGAWYSSSRSPTAAKRKRIVSLSKRLLGMRRMSRPATFEQTVVPTMPTANMLVTGPMDIDGQALSQVSPPLVLPLVSTAAALQLSSASPSIASSVDTPMPDAALLWGNNHIPIPSPSQASLTSPTTSRSPELRVQLPPVPTFNSAGMPTATTPLSATSPFAQSPFAVSGMPSPFGPPTTNGVMVPNPSPVKKKLSLSAYKDRMNKAAAGRAPLGPVSLKPSMSSAEEPNSATSNDAGAAGESPTAEREHNGAAATPATETTNGTS
jgi:uncharacterized protein